MGNKWANQVPVCSGYVGSKDRKRSVDLIVESTEGAFTFYELKVLLPSGDAFHATIELLEYGFAYLFTRSQLPAYKEKALMKATVVNLRVLGTDVYYRDLVAQQKRRDGSKDKRRRDRRVSPTREMEAGLNLALAKFLKAFQTECRTTVAMNFGFSTFPQTFKWDEGDQKSRDGEKIVQGVKGIHPLFQI